MRGFLRTQEVDTFRLWCPRQWARCGYDFKVGSGSQGRYLGSINLNWTYNGECLPKDEDANVRWKTRAADAGVAEWNWSYPYPPNYRLKHVWFDPFQIYEKEVTW